MLFTTFTLSSKVFGLEFHFNVRGVCGYFWLGLNSVEVDHEGHETSSIEPVTWPTAMFDVNLQLLTT